MLKTFLHLFFCTKFLKPAYFNYVALLKTMPETPHRKLLNL